MTMFYDVKHREELVIVNKSSGLAPVQAIAGEDKEDLLGSSSMFVVHLVGEARNKLGVDTMTINVNFWDVYKKDDPKLATVLLDYYQPFKG